MRKVMGYIETLELSISLQLNRRRSAGRGLERRPTDRSAGGPQGRLAAIHKEGTKTYLNESDESCLQLNDIRIPFGLGIYYEAP